MQGHKLGAAFLVGQTKGSSESFHQPHTLCSNEARGWKNSHLHLLLFETRTFANPDIDEGTDSEDERAVRLDELVTVGDRFSYHYDFGDDWMHEVHVEKKRPVDDRLAYPVCIGGARACPPEDCGGPLGYEELLSALLNDDDDDDEKVAWVGGFFDPEGFDVNRTNRSIRALTAF